MNISLGEVADVDIVKAALFGMNALYPKELYDRSVNFFVARSDKKTASSYEIDVAITMKSACMVHRFMISKSGSDLKLNSHKPLTTACPPTPTFETSSKQFLEQVKLFSVTPREHIEPPTGGIN